MSSWSRRPKARRPLFVCVRCTDCGQILNLTPATAGGRYPADVYHHGPDGTLHGTIDERGNVSGHTETFVGFERPPMRELDRDAVLEWAQGEYQRGALELVERNRGSAIVELGGAQ